MRTFPFFLLILFGCSGTPELSSLVPYVSPQPQREMETIHDLDFEPEQVSYLLTSATGVLSTHRSQQLMIPASTQKLVTALAVLDVLGPKHRFRTEIRAKGQTKAGLHKGDLALIGGNEPFLMPQDLQAMVELLYRQGLRKVSGRFLVDDSRLSSEGSLNIQFPSVDVYNGPVSALSLGFNRQYLFWKTVGETQFFFVPPSSQKARLATEPQDFTEKNPQGLVVPVERKEKGREALAVFDPALNTGRVFAQLARDRGIEIPDPERGSVRGRRLVNWRGRRTVLDHVRALLEHSNNLTAELLLTEAMSRRKKRRLTVKESAVALKEWAVEKMGSNWNTVFFENGSGLSTQTRISTKHFVDLLTYASKRKFGGQRLWNLMALGGWNGSLKRQLVTPDTSMRVWAKTGNLFYASGLAGYFFKKGVRHDFAILINDSKARAEFNGLTKREMSAEKDAKKWTKRAKQLQDGLLRSWLSG